MRVGDMSQLERRVAAIRRARGTEGAVLYLCDAQGGVIGINKVKASDYVVRRRLREMFKHAVVQPLARGKVRGVAACPGRKPAPQAELQQLELSAVLQKTRKSMRACTRPTLSAPHSVYRIACLVRVAV